MDKTHPDFNRIKKRIHEGNGVANWEGCVGWDILDRFSIGKMEFILVHYMGYLVDCDHENNDCEFEPCSELYACFYGLEKKAKPFKTPQQALNWALHRVKRPYDSTATQSNNRIKNHQRSEQHAPLEQEEQSTQSSTVDCEISA